jgi:hypothetical protein
MMRVNSATLTSPSTLTFWNTSDAFCPSCGAAGRATGTALRLSCEATMRGLDTWTIAVPRKPRCTVSIGKRSQAETSTPAASSNATRMLFVEFIIVALLAAWRDQ